MTDYSTQELKAALEAVVDYHQPGKHSFFQTLKQTQPGTLDNQAITNLGMLYQGAMQATRQAIYRSTNVANNEQRKEIVRIASEDEEPQTDGQTHYEMLKSMFVSLGADQQQMNILDGISLQDYVNRDQRIPATVREELGAFATTCQHYYDRSFGGIYAVETAAQQWIEELLEGLESAFPEKIKDTTYYREHLATNDYGNTVEDEHSIAAKKLSEADLSTEPQIKAIFSSVAMVMDGLNGIWSAMEQRINTNQSQLVYSQQALKVSD